MKPAKTLLVLVGIAAVAMTAAVPAAGAAPRVPAQQLVATLFSNHPIFSAPGGATKGKVVQFRPITGERTTLPVLQVRPGKGVKWLLVRLPGRPNSHVGWIRGWHTQLSYITWRIRVSLGARTAWVYNSARVIRTFRVVVGRPAAPTPTGSFFVEENVAEPSSFPGAPYALATSARSNVFSEFDGGPGQVALHGTGGGLGGDPGTAESHGCIRFTVPDITWLAQRIYPGTPVDIVP
jgi:lipoprotein-anchoring transpeptidase ErfK/SrfK